MKLKLAVIVLLVFSCQKNESKLLTTSDKVAEFNYVIRGEIRIPTDIEVLKAAYALDLIRQKLDHPKDEDLIETIDETLQSNENFTTSFYDANDDALPIHTDEGTVDLDKVEYWIARQMRFSRSDLAERRLMLTYSGLTKDPIINEQNGYVHVSYEANVAGVLEVKSEYTGRYIDTSPLQVADEFGLPLDPIGVYFETIANVVAVDKIRSIEPWNPEFKTLFTPILAATMPENRPNLSCYTPDGDAVSPFNFFYYFTPVSAGEKEDVAPCQFSGINAHVLSFTKIEPKETFPEFHKLFEDKKVDFFFYYGQVDEEAPEAVDIFSKKLLTRGYEIMYLETSRNSDYQGRAAEEQGMSMEQTLNSDAYEVNSITLTKMVGEIKMRVTLVLEENNYDMHEKMALALKESEVIVYDGHSGYGHEVDKYFTEQSSYGENKYQIIMLDSCDSYQYGKTEILAGKALRDFDFKHYNIDVITTFDSTSGHTQNNILLGRVELAAKNFKDFGAHWNDKIRKRLNWLGIVTSLNHHAETRYDDNHPFYMVSGEVHNQFQPGKSDYFEFRASPKALEEIITSRTSRPHMKEKALSIIYNRLMLDSPTIEKLRAFCLKYKVSDMRTMDNFYGNCQPMRIEPVAGSQFVFDGITYDDDNSISFYENGRVESGYAKYGRVLAGAFGEIKIDSGYIAFYESGKLESAYFSGWREMTILGQNAVIGEEFELDEVGNLVEVYLLNRIQVNTNFGRFYASSEIRLTLAGGLSEFELGSEAKIKVGDSEVLFEAGTDIKIDAKNQVLEIEGDDGLFISHQGFKFPGTYDNSIALYPGTSKLKSMELGDDIVYQGVAYEKYDWLYFDLQGKLVKESEQ